MYWTRELPVKDGWYWFLSDDHSAPAEVVQIKGGLVHWSGDGTKDKLHRELFWGLWYGPMSPPPREVS